MRPLARKRERAKPTTLSFTYRYHLTRHAARMLDAVAVQCPYCGERFEALVDPSAGDAAYVEDCPVCCRPIELRLRLDEDGQATSLEASRDD